MTDTTRLPRDPPEDATTTIGVDLAAQARETAACVLVWRDDRAEIAYLDAGLLDDALVALVTTRTPTKVAIDAPFGWPDAFVAAVANWHSGGRWQPTPIPLLRLRLTDRVVIAETRQQPLSVSSDRIAITAMRCAGLLSRLEELGHPVDRSGSALVAEVYPAAALRQWSLEARGYKGSKPEQQAARARLVDSLSVAWRPWLPLDAHRASLAASDHLVDALLCALLARAVECEQTLQPSEDDRATAQREGWIHLPKAVTAGVVPSGPCEQSQCDGGGSIKAGDAESRSGAEAFGRRVRRRSRLLTAARDAQRQRGVRGRAGGPRGTRWRRASRVRAAR